MERRMKKVIKLVTLIAGIIAGIVLGSSAYGPGREAGNRSGSAYQAGTAFIAIAFIVLAIALVVLFLGADEDPEYFPEDATSRQARPRQRTPDLESDLQLATLLQEQDHLTERFERERTRLVREKEAISNELYACRASLRAIHDRARAAAKIQFFEAASDEKILKYVLEVAPSLHARALTFLGRYAPSGKRYTSEEELLADLENRVNVPVSGEKSTPAPVQKRTCEVMRDVCNATPIEFDDWCDVPENRVYGPDEKKRCWDIIDLATSIEKGLLFMSDYVNTPERGLFAGRTIETSTHKPKLPLTDMLNMPLSTEDVLSLVDRLEELGVLWDYPTLAALSDRFREGKFKNEDTMNVKMFVKHFAEQNGLVQPYEKDITAARGGKRRSRARSSRRPFTRLRRSSTVTLINGPKCS
ncbi:hypothetical protein HDV00_008639 [Rhizophlyctis rosea]|nr:hypothetical protein HDV00_008639 [Rhizophlyctis rosea]